MHEPDWAARLAARFIDAADPKADDAWEAARLRLAVGQEVRGVVVARAPFGAFLDVGVGFPALLKIVDIVGLTPEAYRAGDWCPAGSEVAASVGGLDDRLRQVWLRQVRG